MAFYMVTVDVTKYDHLGLGASISQAYVPVKAMSEEEAQQRAVLWHGDGHEVKHDDGERWYIVDTSRGVMFRAVKCIEIRKDELETFLSITTGLTAGIIVGHGHTKDGF